MNPIYENQFPKLVQVYREASKHGPQTGAGGAWFKEQTGVSIHTARRWLSAGVMRGSERQAVLQWESAAVLDEQLGSLTATKIMTIPEIVREGRAEYQRAKKDNPNIGKTLGEIFPDAEDPMRSMPVVVGMREGREVLFQTFPGGGIDEVYRHTKETNLKHYPRGILEVNVITDSKGRTIYAATKTTNSDDYHTEESENARKKQQAEKGKMKPEDEGLFREEEEKREKVRAAALKTWETRRAKYGSSGRKAK